MAKKTSFTKNFMLQFKGWAQGRIPTDPDPSDEPRGVSGYTFALPGEPDLDRVIYFQKKKGVIRRSHCPEVGVYVCGGYEFETTGKGSDVVFKGTPKKINKGHRLFGAKMDLLNNARFESRNSTIIYDGFGVMDPFILSVEGNRLSIQRRFSAEPGKKPENIENYPINTLTPFMLNTVFMNSVEMILSAGVLDRAAFRNNRKRLLKKDLIELKRRHSKSKEYLIQKAALEKRISELEMNNPQERRTNQIGTQVLISYPLNAGTAYVNGKNIKPGAVWPTTIWFGGWDADALGFYVNGYVQIILEE
jgi:hypothetical protein